MKMLVITAKQEQHDFFKLWLTKRGASVCHTAASVDQALEILKLEPDLGLIISDDALPNKSGSSLLEQLKKSQIEIPFILCGQNLQDNQGIATVDEALSPNVTKDLERLIGNLVQFHVAESALNQNYSPIRISTLGLMSILPCDLYLKINDKKYTRIKKREAIFDQSDMDHYLNKKLVYLYIKSTEIESVLQRFAMVLTSFEQKLDLTESMDDLEDLILQTSDAELKVELRELQHSYQNFQKEQNNLVASIKLSEKTQKVLNRTLKKLGAAPELVSLIKTSVHSTMHNLESKPEIESLIRSARSSDQEYLTAHPVLLANAVCVIANRMGWQSKILACQFCVCAFLHDIYLTSSKLAKIKDITSSDQNLTATEKSLVANHAAQAADLAVKYSLISPSFEAVIKNHHEFPDGQGFPSKLSDEQLSPATCLFIFAHEMVDYILENPDNVNAIDNFYRINSKHFRQGHFKKIFMIMAGYSPDVGRIKLRQT